MSLVSIAAYSPDAQSSTRRNDAMAIGVAGQAPPVVVREEAGKFFYYDSLDSFIIAYDAALAEVDIKRAQKTPAFVSLHEVVSPNVPSRMRFDLDVKKSIMLPDGPVDVLHVDELIEIIIERTCEFYNREFHPDADVTERDFIVFSAHGASKYSFHVLTPIYCANRESLRQFSASLLLRIEHAGHPLFDCIDQDVYKSWQNFRLPLSSKREDPGRVKRLDPTWMQIRGRTLDHHWSECLLGYYHEREPLHLVTEVETVPLRASLAGPEDIRTRTRLVLDAVRTYWRGHGLGDFDATWELRCEQERVLWFKRLAPSHCEICDVVHESDNTLYVSIGSGSDTIPIFVCCRRAASSGIDRRIRVGTFSGAGVRASIQAAIRAKIESHNPQYLSLHRKKIYAELVRLRFDRQRQMRMHSAPELEAFPVVRTLYVRAAMKMGKTAKLLDFFARAKPATILYISFRQTFSSAIQKRLAEGGFGFTSYAELRGELIDMEIHPRLIVQVESLARVRLAIDEASRAPLLDVLVLDEVESVLSQITSPFVHSVSFVYALFQRIVAAARHVICLDANLADRTLRTIERLRAGGGPVQLGGIPARYYYENYCTNATGQHMYFLPAAKDLYWQIYTMVSSGKRVFVCSSSLDEARLIYMALRRDFAHIEDVTGPKAFGGEDYASELALDDEAAPPAPLRLAMYTSETSPSIKQLHFHDVNKWWAELDILIYTPTVTAGISFDVPHFDVGFGVFTSMSCDVETCRQMLGRVRNVRDERYYVVLQVRECSFVTDRTVIERTLLNARAMRAVLPEGFPAPVEAQLEDGHIETYPTNFFDIVVENIIHANLSRNAFAERFIEQVAETGVQLHYCEENPAADALGGAGSYDKAGLREEYLDVEARAIAAAKPLEHDQWTMITQAKTSGHALVEISPDDMLRARKTTFMMIYCMPEPRVDYAFIRTFGRADVIRVFRNVLEFSDALRWGFAEPRATIAAVDAALAVKQPKDDRVLRRWFVGRVLERLSVSYLGDATPLLASAFEGAIALIEADIEGRLNRGRRYAGRNLRNDSWNVIIMQFDLTRRQRAKSIITAALKSYFGIELIIGSDRVGLKYPVAIMRQAIETIEAKKATTISYEN